MTGRCTLCSRQCALCCTLRQNNRAGVAGVRSQQVVPHGEAPDLCTVRTPPQEAESSHQAYLKLRRDYEELQNTYRSLVGSCVALGGDAWGGWVRRAPR